MMCTHFHYLKMSFFIHKITVMQLKLQCRPCSHSESKDPIGLWPLPDILFVKICAYTWILTTEVSKILPVDQI